MRQRYLLILIVPLLTLLISCDALLVLLQSSNFLQSSNVTISFVNGSSDFDLQINYFYSDDKNINQDVLVLPVINEEGNETIMPGSTFTFSDSCDNLQAFIVNDAELQAALSSPNRSTGVLRIDSDFSCGDRVVFTFTPGSLVLGTPTSLTITTTVTPSSSLP